MDVYIVEKLSIKYCNVYYILDSYLFPNVSKYLKSR